MVVATCRRCTVGGALGPRLLLDVEAEQIVEHRASVVAAKHVYAIFVGDHRVLTASGFEPKNVQLVMYQ